MADSYCHLIPKIFLQQYVYDLSPYAFSTLCRFYKFYIDQKGKEVSISFKKFKRIILVSNNQDEYEEVLGELDTWDLVKRDYKQNIYSLNLTKIDYDNLEYLEVKKDETKEKFNVRITDKKFEKDSTVSPGLNRYVDNILARYSERLSKKMRKMIEGNIEWYLRTQNSVGIKDINYLMKPLISCNDGVLEQVCDIYNNNKFAQVPAHYVWGIAKNISKGKDLSKHKRSVKKESLAKFDRELREREESLAIKVVTGDTKSCLAYQACMKIKDFDTLREMHKLGIKLLTEQGKESSVFLDYEWLND